MGVFVLFISWKADMFVSFSECYLSTATIVFIRVAAASCKRPQTWAGDCRHFFLGGGGRATGHRLRLCSLPCLSATTCSTPVAREMLEQLCTVNGKKGVGLHLFSCEGRRHTCAVRISDSQAFVHNPLHAL